jgi:GNAT superfamily N-acetyltransferase
VQLSPGSCQHRGGPQGNTAVSQPPETLVISLNGTTDLPAGKIASIVTSLEMTVRPERRDDPPDTDGLALAPIAGDGIARYLALYRQVGEPWLWFSRLLKPREEVTAILADPAVSCFALRKDGRDAGLLELDFRDEGEAELAFFGLDSAALGRGAGRWLMNRALALAWARPIRRLWVHTCTLDHPDAVVFYRRSGFVPFRRGIEVVDDPRRVAGFPREAAPHHPVIG